MFQVTCYVVGGVLITIAANQDNGNHNLPDWAIWILRVGILAVVLGFVSPMMSELIRIFI